MDIKTTPLTDTQIKSLKATNKDKSILMGVVFSCWLNRQELSFGDLNIKKQYQIKRHYCLLVNYPEISLKQIRMLRDEA